MPADDPFLWTVDDLVAELCYSKALFQASGCQAENLPDPTKLGHQIRNQHITGAMFLTASSTHALLDDSDIHQRAALTSVIDRLRRRSFIYQQHTATAGVEMLDLNYASSSRSPGTFSDAMFTDKTGQKRRKVTHITTPPLATASHILPEAAAVPTAGHISEASSGEGLWDHLLRWELPGADDEIDLAAEDFEDEERVGPADGAEEDMEDEDDEDDEVEQAAQGRSKLSTDQVVEIINERVEYYTHSWIPNKGAAKGEEIRYDPEAMLEEAKATGRRQQLIERYETDRAYYSQRLDKLCDQIFKFPGPNAEKVRYQCRNLEVTIDSMELAEWLLSIYKLEPVHDSDEEHGDPNTAIEPHSHIAANQSRPSVEIIDLGSPSETSGDEDTMVYGHATEPALNMNEHHAIRPSQFHSPDPVIAETIEPRVYTHVEPSVQDRNQPSSSHASHGDGPEHASIVTVRCWKWSDLVDQQDRKRIVSKVVHGMKTEDREMIRTRLNYVGKKNITREILACIGMLAKGESRMQGVLSRDLPKIVILTKLFLSWWFCNNCYQEEPSILHLEELQECLQEDLSDPRIFCDYLSTIMNTTFSEEALRHPERPSQAEIIEISDDDDEQAPRPATRRNSGSNRILDPQQGPAIIID